MLHVFVVIGWDWRYFIAYKVPNNVGKMTAKVYTRDILPTLQEELISRKLTLCQDADLAHRARQTISWAEKHGIDLLTLPGSSPDLSIAESLAHPVKQLFHAQRCTEQAAFKRFKRIWAEQIDQSKVQKYYESYTKRLHDIRRVGGQMSEY